MMTALNRLLEGRRVLVTGGARGLGYAFAQAIGRAGAHVVIADILAERVQQSAAELVAEGLTVHGVTVDLAQPDSIDACIAETTRLLGGLDGLVNNASITNSGGKTCEELSLDTWDQVMQVNVRGTWLMTKACLPALRASGHGAIVNLASDTPLWGAPNLLAYVASKGAIIAMTRSLARELGDRQHHGQRHRARPGAGRSHRLRARSASPFVQRPAGHSAPATSRRRQRRRAVRAVRPRPLHHWTNLAGQRRVRHALIMETAMTDLSAT